MFPSIVVVLVGGRKSTQFLFTTKNPPSLRIAHLLLSRSLHHKPVIEEEEEEKPNLPIDNPSSLTTTVSYLINSCGLSAQSALSASKKITIKTTAKPNSNLALLKSQGFSDAQITRLVSIYPSLLLSNWDKCIKPKFDYLLSLGYSNADLTNLISLNPIIIKASLQRKLKPNFDLLRPIFSNGQQLFAAVHRSSAWLFTLRLETNFLPNIRILQSYGVPAPNIAKLAAMEPRTLIQDTAARFRTTVESLVKMGFDPLSTMFVYGISAMTGWNPSTWKRKVALYKSLGWSEAEFISAFRKQPFLMRLSEEKIKRVMDFAAEKMNWGPSFIASHPVLLKMSLEKRTAPRCSVIRVLETKGLVKSASVHFLMIGESDFLNRYVIKFQDQVPELLQAYKGNLESGEL